jgi:glycosyltransferase involved in cell wall biosynthesis
MKVDVVLITYNQSEYVSQALEGLIMQKVCDDLSVRVIIADDCSSDSTIEIIRQYELKSPFSFVYLPNEENLGHVLNYKRTFEICDADYVAILEGDDWWCNPYHIQKHVDFLEEHRECVLSSSRPCIYDVNSQKYFMDYFPVEQKPLWYISTEENIPWNKITNLSTCVIRSSVLQKVITTEKLWSVDMIDWPLELMLSQYGFIVKHEEPTTVYRQQNKGLWSGLDDCNQRKLILSLIDQSDALLEYKYKVEFDKLRSKLLKDGKNRRFKDFCPPILVQILMLLVPPFFRKKK